MILISSSDTQSSGCYVETANLDGSFFLFCEVSRKLFFWQRNESEESIELEIDAPDNRGDYCIVQMFFSNLILLLSSYRYFSRRSNLRTTEQ